jgi:hypothetical protein
MRSSSLLLRGGAILCTLLSTTYATAYVVKDTYTGTTFLDQFDFVTVNDGNGFVSYVSSLNIILTYLISF